MGNQVKHLLIILSILILSSPVIGEDTGVLYQYETSTGIKWETFGDEKVQPKYEGDISNGKPNGFGVLTYPNDEKNVVGEWKNGKYDGQVILTFLDGEKYEGEFKDGLKHGQGTYTWNDGEKYVGEYKDEKKNGQGTKIWTNGDMYEGGFKDGRYDGQGTYTWSDGRKYVGEWKDGETKRSWYCHFKGWEVCRRMEGE